MTQPLHPARYRWAAVVLFLAAHMCSFGDETPGAAANLARAKGATAIGSGSNGPFVISKLNDGRTDTLGMWSSDGKDGAFGGIKLGAAPVAFNTVRFYLYNGRAAFTGWRLEGADDLDITDDPEPGVSPGFAEVYDPELLAADPNGAFTNSTSKEHNVVTISFPQVATKAVRLVFPKMPPGPKASIGVPEMEVYNSADDLTPHAALTPQPGVALDNTSNTITIAKPLPLADLASKLSIPPGVAVFAHDAEGAPIKDSELLRHGCSVVSRFQTGGKDAPFKTEYKCYRIVDTSAPPPAPKPPKLPRPPKPPRPPVSIASVSGPPDGTANLILGKSLTGSIRPESAEKFAATGAGDWFLTQQIPQWIAVDFGAETEFNYFAIASAQVVHFVLQSSNDAVNWKTLVEVDRVRPPYRWNGYLETTKARHLRLVVLKPSWDVHVKMLTVAHLASPPEDGEGKPATPIRPPTGEASALSDLPKAALPLPAGKQ